MSANGRIVIAEVVVNHSPRRAIVVPEADFPRCIRQLRAKNEDAPPSLNEFLPRGAFFASYERLASKAFVP